MAQLEIDSIYGVRHDQIMLRNIGVEIAESDRHRPLRKLGEPLALKGVLQGEFAVFVVAHAMLRDRRESYLITEWGPSGLARAVLSDAILEHPQKLCTPYLRYVLAEVDQESLEEFSLGQLGEFVLRSGSQPLHSE